ncbi:MAG: flagellar M-ring protein FliF [Candidatus Omnitrophica bacterium]|nr:flagellar M-ring protein FliF [Candidatus Omnitrophota bacterium]
MREFLLKLQSQFQKYWQNLSQVQRIIIIGLALLILFSIVGFTFWATRPEYAVLFTNLSPEDTSGVIEKLRERAVPYRISRDGGTVLVPSPKVYEVRLALAGEGVLQGGGIGYELFDKNFFGMTEFTQNLNYQRALQGELERTIRQISGVEGARVHLVLPKEELFIEQQKEPTASVLLKLAPGIEINKSQIRAIVNLVQTSVEGLDKENISIIDTNGVILSDVIADEFEMPGMLADVFQMKKKIERTLQEEVRVLLERIVGRGRVAVKANVELNLARQETTEEEYTPVVDEKKGIVRSEQRKTEQFKGTGTGAGGVPGTESNVTSIPSYPQSGGSGSSSDYSRQEQVTNYEINKKLSHVRSIPGDVKKISISVLLDGEFPEEVIDSLKQVVASGIGIQPDRGDDVVVEAFHFDKTYLEEEKLAQERLARLEFRNLIFKGGVIGFVTLIILLFTLSMLRHARLIRKTKEQIKETQQKIIGPDGQPIVVGPGGEIIPGQGGFAGLPFGGDEVENMKAQLAEVAVKDPEKVARVIKELITSR